MLSTAAATSQRERKLSVSPQHLLNIYAGRADASWPQMMALIFLFCNQLCGSDYLELGANTAIFGPEDNDDTVMGLKVIADDIEAYDDDSLDGIHWLYSCLGNKGHGAYSRPASNKGDFNL